MQLFRIKTCLAALAGFVEFENGVCKLQLTSVNLATTASSSSTTSPSQNTSSGMPPIQDIMSQIASETSSVHASKKTLSRRQLQSHICYIQRSLNLTTGLKGEWTPQALEMLNKWLASPKKGTGTKAASPLAILDGDVSDKPDTKDLEVKVKEAEDTKDLPTENSDVEAAKDAKDAKDSPAENPDLELKETENTHDTQAENAVDTKDADSDSDSSYSSSSSSSWTLPTDWRTWPAEWHDVWQESLFLLERSAGESQKKADIAMAMLKSVHKAKLRWDQAQ